MLGFKTKELRRSARSCTELRGVDVEEGRTFSFCFVPSSRVAKVNRGPSLMGSMSGNESEIQSLVEKVQKKRQSRDGWRTCASFGSVPDADCEDRARGRPRTKPHLCEAKYHAKPCRRVPGPTDRGGGRHSVDRKPNPPGERSEKTEAHRERVRRRRGWSPLMSLGERLLLEERESQRRG